MRIFLCFIAATLLSVKAQNVANPKTHPYADLSGGREGLVLASEPVNEARLYHFYQRQADYYMTGADVPDIIPAYPGLDGGLHGHWGKHNQNNHEDGRWNDSDLGSVVTQVFRHGDDLVVLKGISVRLTENASLSTCFDPLTLSYRAIWQDGFIEFHPFRWGSSRNAQLKGTPWLINNTSSRHGKFLGYYRLGDAIVFRYQFNGSEILDQPSAGPSDSFVRTLEFPQGSKKPITLHVGPITGLKSTIVGTEVSLKGESLHIQPQRPGAIVQLQLSKAVTTPPEPSKPSTLTKGGPPRWPQRLAMPGQLGNARTATSAYVTDTLAVPYDNPYNVVMQLTGIDFFPNGDALVTTLSGDVWKITGIDASLQNVHWKRYATGFNQPIGLRIDPDGIFILDRGQITRLHDLDDNDEADYYENYANDFGGYNRSHTHTFGLARLKDGSFTFVQRESILRTGPDQVTRQIAWGVRNCMGIGSHDDYALVAPQEGSWTPTSEIIQVNEGEFYGLPVKGDHNPHIAMPLCYVPRGVDGSTGGMLEITSDQWGPYRGSFVGISYGYGNHYLIHRDEHGTRPMGATVPMESEFLAGAMRGAFHPTDGQLYVAGLDGWGDYSVKDGCLHRVRYLSKPVHQPQGFEVFENGLRIDFPNKLDPATATNTANYFVQQWNYEYAKRYGSPEFSSKTPDSLGHDRLAIRSVLLLDNQQSIFIEMPTMEPVMQMHIRMHLKAADGSDFKADLFPSILHLDQRFDHDTFAPAIPNKPTVLALRIKRSDEEAANAKLRETGEAVEGARQVTIKALGGLQYDTKTFQVKPGEAIQLDFINTDVMPHNLVIVAPDGAQTVGVASFAMLNNPEAGTMHYVPDLPEVLAHTHVINPETTHRLHFQAPQEPGTYPFICTFPGHWQAMHGEMKVVAE